MNTEDKTAVIAQISYREYLIAQIASGMAANSSLTESYDDFDLAKGTISFADAIINALNQEKL